MESEAIRAVNRQYWEEHADQWFGVTALPEYGVSFVTEEELHLFGDVAGKRMLEIGCGSGHSLLYHAERGAGELWGLDQSGRQLEVAGELLASHGLSPRLIRSAMEAECGIPRDYFDIAYSIYAIGWTSDLVGTFRRIHGYLKPGGMFIFSWKHPVNGCVQLEDGALRFRKSYFDDRWTPQPAPGSEVLLSNRKISTYVNALCEAGFRIERMEEQTDAATLALSGEVSERAQRARMYPLSFVFKARRAE